MNKAMIFTVQIPENGKPITWAQSASDVYLKKQELAEELIRDWFERNEYDNVSKSDIEDLAYAMRHDGYAWYDDSVCFELTEVYG